jgi:hypothetical protein
VVSDVDNNTKTSTGVIDAVSVVPLILSDVKLVDSNSQVGRDFEEDHHYGLNLSPRVDHSSDGDVDMHCVFNDKTNSGSKDACLDKFPSEMANVDRPHDKNQSHKHKTPKALTTDELNCFNSYSTEPQKMADCQVSVKMEPVDNYEVICTESAHSNNGVQHFSGTDIALATHDATSGNAAASEQSGCGSGTSKSVSALTDPDAPVEITTYSADEEYDSDEEERQQCSYAYSYRHVKVVAIDSESEDNSSMSSFELELRPEQPSKPKEKHNKR